MKKWIYFTPVYMFIAGFIIGSINASEKPFGYWIGTGIGNVVTTAIPSIVVGTIHYLIVRNKQITNGDRDDNLIDSEDVDSRKYSWYYLFASYIGIFGIIMSVVMFYRFKA